MKAPDDEAHASELHLGAPEQISLMEEYKAAVESHRNRVWEGGDVPSVTQLLASVPQEILNREQRTKAGR
jgi:hypothetical protein